MVPHYMDTQSLPTLLIPWIHKTPQLECLAISGPLFSDDHEIESMDWEPFVKVLEHAAHVEQLIVVVNGREEVEPEYMGFLKCIVPCRVSVCLWTRREWESKDYVTSRIDSFH